MFMNECQILDKETNAYYDILKEKFSYLVNNKPEPLSIIAIQLISIKTAYIVCLPMKAGHLAKNLHYY